MAEPNFNWGLLEGPSCVRVISDCYDEVTRWKPNLFSVPFGNTGERFVVELTRLFNCYASASSLESIALKAAYLFPHLVLQKSSANLTSKIIRSHIDRRLDLWVEGQFRDLLVEGQDIQSHLSSPKSNVLFAKRN